jgi:hypothetical protein
MSDLPDNYKERMGYMPCYKFPTEMGDDATFEYYKFRVPRHYIREHIKDGLVWPDYNETTEEGTRDESVVLGVGFFPVYSGVEYLEEDADFLYYKVKVPKVFLDTQIEGTPHTYRLLYETKDFKLKTPEEKAEEASVLEIRSTKAGDEMPGRIELKAVRKEKEVDTLLYEIVLYCPNCGTEHNPEVGADLWAMLHARRCECGHTKLELRSCKSVLEEKKDE